MSNETPSPSSHTPTPWEIAPYVHGDEVVNVVHDYKRVPGGAQAHWIAELDASFDYDSDREAVLEELYANAEFIVHAVNCHEALVAAIRYALDDDNDWMDVREVLRSVLATADASRTRGAVEK